MTRLALLATCPRCNQPTIEADHDYAYNVDVTTMRADPTHITPETETACIIIGRPTYNHWTTNTGHHLAKRCTPWHTFHPGGQPTHILPAHQCNATLPGAPIELTPTKNELPPDTPPPF